MNRFPRIGFLVLFCMTLAVTAQQPDPVASLSEKKQAALSRLDVNTATELQALAKKALDRNDTALALAASKTATGLNPSPDLDPEEEAAVLSAMPKEEALPREAKMILEKRAVRQKEINQVYLQELAKWKAKFIAEKNIRGLADVEDEIVKSTPAPEKLGSDLLDRDQGKNKVVVSSKVIEVLDEGLLFMDAGRICILKNHPEHRSALQGMALNCYAIRTGEELSYGHHTAAQRKAQLYHYHARRFGK
jgi:hypothetical protein